MGIRHTSKARYYDDNGTFLWEELWNFRGIFVAGQNFVAKSVIYIVIGVALSGDTLHINVRHPSKLEIENINKYGAPTGMNSPVSYWRPKD